MQLSPFFMQEVARANLARANILVASASASAAHAAAAASVANAASHSPPPTPPRGTTGQGQGQKQGYGYETPHSSPLKAHTQPMKSESKFAPQRPDDPTPTHSATPSALPTASNLLSGLVGAGRTLMGGDKPGVNVSKGATPQQSRTSSITDDGQKRPDVNVMRSTSTANSNNNSNNNSNDNSTFASPSKPVSNSHSTQQAQGPGIGGGNNIPPGVVMRTTGGGGGVAKPLSPRPSIPSNTSGGGGTVTGTGAGGGTGTGTGTGAGAGLPPGVVMRSTATPLTTEGNSTPSKGSMINIFSSLFGAKQT